MASYSVGAMRKLKRVKKDVSKKAYSLGIMVSVKYDDFKARAK